MDTNRPNSDDLDVAEERPPSKSPVVLFRELAAFELRLFLDGLKDLVLAPGAVIVAIIGLLTHQGTGPLHKLMKLGARFEQWLGLYEPLGSSNDDEDDAPYLSANRVLRAAERQIRTKREQ
jgi:hypothetical protein